MCPGSGRRGNLAHGDETTECYECGRRFWPEDAPQWPLMPVHAPQMLA